MPFSYRDQALINQSLGNLTDQLQKWKQDKQAEAIYNELHPEAPIKAGEGQYGVGLRTKLGDNALNRQYKNALIEKTLRPPAGRAVDPYAADKFDLMKRDKESLIKSRESTARVPAAERPDSAPALDHDLRKEFGLGLSDLPDVKGVTAGNVDSTGKWVPADNGDYWQFHTHSGEVFTQPKDKIAPFLRRFRALKPGFSGADTYKGTTSVPAPVQPKINGTPFAEPDLPVSETPPVVTQDKVMVTDGKRRFRVAKDKLDGALAAGYRQVQ